MENDFLSALRALMSGGEPYDRHPVPDFQVLVDLAPLLEPEALARLFEEISMMGMATRAQFRALAAMAVALTFGTGKCRCVQARKCLTRREASADMRRTRRG